MAPKAQAQPARQSMSNAVASKSKLQSNDRRKTVSTARDEIEMRVPSSQRSDIDSQDGIKAQKKFALDMLKSTTQRCSTVQDSIRDAETEFVNMIQRIEESCATKESSFVRAFRGQIATVDQEPAASAQKRRSDGTTVQPASYTNEQLRQMTNTLLAGCANLENQYTHAVKLVEESRQEMDLGAGWEQDIICLTSTLKAGARAAQRSIVTITNNAREAAQLTILSGEEADAVQALGMVDVHSETLKGDLGQLLRDAHGGLRKLTRSLPVELDDVSMSG